MGRRTDPVVFAAWTFIALAVAAGVILLIVGLAEKPTSDGVQSVLLSQMKGSLGDILSGTLGVCLSFSATLFMVVTFKEQRRQHQEQLRQSNRERFENTFFNMLSMYREVRDSVTKYQSDHPHFSSLEKYYDGFRQFCSTGENCAQLERIKNYLSGHDITAVDLERAEEGLGKMYSAYADSHGESIRYFFRYVHNMINFVICQWGTSEDAASDVKQYLNLIQAQMTDEELGLIFYDAISTYGLNRNFDKQFKHNLDCYGFLENISPQVLLNRSDHLIYQSTIFKFLNAQEQSRKMKSLTD